MAETGNVAESMDGRAMFAESIGASDVRGNGVFLFFFLKQLLYARTKQNKQNKSYIQLV